MSKTMKWKCWLGKMCMCNSESHLICSNVIKETSKTKTMIQFNNPETHEERAAQKPLTLVQEEGVIQLINDIIKHCNIKINEADIESIQAFVWHYENLCHEVTTTGGMSERPADTQKTGVQLISKEREEQIEKHGRTIESDFKTNGLCQLAEAAGKLLLLGTEDVRNQKPTGWSNELWEKMCDKTDYKERLVMVGALIAAEIDRVQFKEQEDSYAERRIKGMYL